MEEQGLVTVNLSRIKRKKYIADRPRLGTKRGLGDRNRNELGEDFLSKVFLIKEIEFETYQRAYYLNLKAKEMTSRNGSNSYGGITGVTGRDGVSLG